MESLNPVIQTEKSEPFRPGLFVYSLRGRALFYI